MRLKLTEQVRIAILENSGTFKTIHAPQISELTLLILGDTFIVDPESASAAWYYNGVPIAVGE